MVKCPVCKENFDIEAYSDTLSTDRFEERISEQLDYTAHLLEHIATYEMLKHLEGSRK